MRYKNLSKLLATMLAAVVACTAFSGCAALSKKNAADIEGVKNYVAPAADTEGTLKIIVDNLDKFAVSAAKSQFKLKYPKVEVEVALYNELAADTTELEKQHTKQMMGDGADIVLMQAYAYNRICDAYKVQQAGAYLDLNQYFNRDPDWNWDGYSKAVIDGMMMGDKLYLLPLYFELPVMVTTDTLLAESGIDLEKCDTGIGLMEQLTKCAEEANAGEYDFSVIAARWMPRFDELFDVNPVRFDSGKGVVKFTKEFDKTLEAYDALGQQLGWFEEWTQEKLSQEAKIWNLPYYQQLEYARNIFVISMGCYELFDGIYSLVQMKKMPVIVPFYTADGSGITAQATLTASIATGCKNPELAYEFIKCLLSEEAQGMFESTDNTGGGFYRAYNQPINQAAVEYVAGAGGDFYYSVIDAAGNEVGCRGTDFVDQMNALADKVVHTYMFMYTDSIDAMYFEGASQYFMPYFKRVKSLDLCYEDAETQLTIYATE